MTDPALLLVVAALGVALVVLLITWVRMPAFLALAAGSLFVGLAARMPLADIPRAFQDGVGDTLGFVAMVIGLGTVIGKLLAESGGAGVVSAGCHRAMGERRLDWAMMLSGFIIGLPVFFQVGLVLLAPVLFTVARQTGTPLLRLGMPLVAGLSTAHGLVPPHPGPLAAIERLGADTGRTLFYSLIVGLPVAIVSGPLFGAVHRRRGSRRAGRDGGSVEQRQPRPGRRRSAITLLTILMPVLLMLVAALAQAALPSRRRVRRWSSPALRCRDAAGDAPGALHVWHGLRVRSRAAPALRGRIAPPIAGVLLVVGAGGGFGRVLDAAGVDTAIAQAMSGMPLSPMVLAGSSPRCCVCRSARLPWRSSPPASIMAPIVDGDAGREQGSAGRGDRRRLAHREPRQRRRILAGQGVLQHERAADAGDLDGPRNDRLGRWAWWECLRLGVTAEPRRVTRSGHTGLICYRTTRMRPARASTSRTLPIDWDSDSRSACDRDDPGPVTPETLEEMLIVDAHLDLAMNALEWNRDLTRPIDEIRAREHGHTDKPTAARGRSRSRRCAAAASASAWRRRSRVTSTPSNPFPGWHSPEQAWAHDPGPARLVSLDGGARRAGADHATPAGSIVKSRWSRRRRRRADRLRAQPRRSRFTRHAVGHLERAYAQGLRAVGPAHYGPGVYAQGTNAQGDLGARGRELLREMERLEHDPRRHASLRRQFSRRARPFRWPRLGEPLELPLDRRAQPPVQRRPDPRAHRARRRHRRGVRCVDDRPGWVRGESTPERAGVTLERIIDHIDHICQIAGNARHCRTMLQPCAIAVAL